MCKGRVTGIVPRLRSSLELGENLEIGLARHAPDGGQGGGVRLLQVKAAYGNDLTRRIGAPTTRASELPRRIYSLRDTGRAPLGS